jgi:hypothetical protein
MQPSRAMRRVLLILSFLGLTAALVGMWTFRFERVPSLPTWNLADFQQGWSPIPGVEWRGSSDQARLRLETQGKPIEIRLEIPGAPLVEGLHLKFRLTSHHLIPGAEKWQDGRFLVEWHHPENDLPTEEVGIGSVHYTIPGELQDLVILPSHRPAIPTLRLGHLGRSGDFELSELEITAVRERSVWKLGRWFLLLGWIAWGTAFVRSWPGISRWRAVSAAAVWVLLATHFIVPGPWRLQHPLVVGFQLGTATAAGSPAPKRIDPAASAAELASGPVEPLGKLPEQGSLVLRIKMTIAHARPLLHAFLLFAPTMVFLVLLGRKLAVVLASAFAVSIEAAQTAYGYGFDLADVGDLATDAAGIALAVWLYGRFAVARSRRETA